MVYKDYLLKDLNQRDSLFHQIQGELAHLLHHVPYLHQVYCLGLPYFYEHGR
ncbi:hypothetical protein [Streptococcus pneumoniae]|uniref:hypothetical protein n=1 Tax=Streptococcus pneumoniae TaxID=1313 RepID=UPI001869F3B6|nr:hypothetical protein [Streptococcus pneumoniae]